MDDLQAGARVAGLSPLSQRAAGDAGRACFGIPPPLLDPLEAAFEDDLASWLARLYAVRDERRLMGRLVRTYGVGWAAVTAATLAMLLFGAIAVLAAAVLLGAALVVAWQAAMSRIPARLERRPSAGAPGSSGPFEHPMFGPDERAQLVRLMNLSRAAWRPATRMLLRAELREARSRGPLANWRPLYDLEDVVLGDAFASTARSG
jgi:hypothetical protein